MNYCPHCAAALSKITDVCPHCNKAIDSGLLQSLYVDQKSSQESQSVRRKIWFKEHALVIVPGLALITGLIAGFILSYGYAQIEFAAEREEFQSEIARLQAAIAQKDARVANTSEDFQNQLNQKNEIIGILDEELDIMGRIINFTIRLANNSTITPGTAEEADFYRRNVQYLQNQFNLQRQKLEQLDYQNIRSFNLITVPQMMSE